MGTLQTVQAIGKAIGCSPQTKGEVLWLSATPPQLTEHREVKLVPTQSLPPFRLMFSIQEGALHATK